MSLTGGTVVIADDGTATGSGLSLDLYTALVGTPTFASLPATPAGVQGKRQLAELCGVFGAAIVSHITTNAVVSVSIPTQATGLQTLPQNIEAGEPTGGPSEAKSLSGTIT